MYPQQSQSPAKNRYSPALAPISTQLDPSQAGTHGVGCDAQDIWVRGGVTWIAAVWWSCKGFMTKRTLKHHPLRVQSLSEGAQQVGEALSNDTSMARVVTHSIAKIWLLGVGLTLFTNCR
jgi:hypothetical protein